MTAATCFEDRLLEQLRQVVADRPAPAAVTYRPPRRTRLALAGSAAVAAAAPAVALVATSGGVTPAYAVQSHADGSVTVTIHSLSDAAGLQRRLRAAGVPAVVDYVTVGRRGCVLSGVGAGVQGESTDTAGGAASGPVHSTGGEAGTDTGPSTSGPGPAPGDRATTSSTTIGGDGVMFTIDPGHIAPGKAVYITTSTDTKGSIAMAIANQRPGTAC
jgi:hypothetical protein